jgi:hypothetical protein
MPVEPHNLIFYMNAQQHQGDAGHSIHSGNDCQYVLLIRNWSDSHSLQVVENTIITWTLIWQVNAKLDLRHFDANYIIMKISILSRFTWQQTATLKYAIFMQLYNAKPNLFLTYSTTGSDPIASRFRTVTLSGYLRYWFLLIIYPKFCLR